MLKKIDEATLVGMIERDNAYQAETLRLSKERTAGRIALCSPYCTMQNFYIRKNKYEKAMKKDFTKSI